MNKPFNWKDVDRNKFVHPLDGRILRRFLSAREAACNGQRPTYEGYKWAYAND